MYYIGITKDLNILFFFKKLYARNIAGMNIYFRAVLHKYLPPFNPVYVLQIKGFILLT